MSASQTLRFVFNRFALEQIGSPVGAKILFVFHSLYVANKIYMSKRWFPKILLFFIITIGVVNALAAHFFLYWKLPWLDIPMHFLGGAWIGLMILWVYYLSGKFKDVPENRRSIPYIYGLTVTITMIIGILWEIFEFSLDLFIVFGEFNGFYDTISDLIFAIVGTIIATKYFISREYYKEQK